jgi:hypothetical protein
MTTSAPSITTGKDPPGWQWDAAAAAAPVDIAVAGSSARWSLPILPPPFILYCRVALSAPAWNDKSDPACPKGNVVSRMVEDPARGPWTKPLSTLGDDDAVLARGDRPLPDSTVFVAHFSRDASGGELLALRWLDGAKLWKVPIQGLGPIGYSKYQNHIQIAVRPDGDVVLYGKESGGEYVEVHDFATGALLSDAAVRAPL